MESYIQKFKYPECLEIAKLKIKGTFTASNKHHELECMLCGNVFKATPKSKMTNYKEHGSLGCPRCTMDKRFENEKINMKIKLTSMGFIYSDFRGKLDYINAMNTNCSCGRYWKTKPIHLLSGNSFCKPCNDEAKSIRMREANNERVIKSLQNIHEFKVYRKLVRSYSYTNYLKNKHLFKLERSKENHLDHIVPISFCFTNNIPPEVCACLENLDVIPANENRRKYISIPDPLPEFIVKFLQTPCN